MVEVKAETKCRIAFIYEGQKVSFDFEKDEVKDIDELHLDRLLKTNIIKQIN